MRVLTGDSHHMAILLLMQHLHLADGHTLHHHSSQNMTTALFNAEASELMTTTAHHIQLGIGDRALSLRLKVQEGCH